MRYEDLAGAKFVLRLNADDVLVMHADDAHVIRAGDGDVAQRVGAAAPSWRHERALRERRARMAAWLMVYVDALAGAKDRGEVIEALCTCAPCIAGGLQAQVCASDGAYVGDTPVVLTAAESGHASLAPLFPLLSAAQLLCCPVSDDALLVLVERRRDRIFTAEDRDVLEWIVKQARRALRRLDD